jgi:hypothetical protein
MKDRSHPGCHWTAAILAAGGAGKMPAFLHAGWHWTAAILAAGSAGKMPAFLHAGWQVGSVRHPPRGILHEFTGRSRNRRFRYEEYIRLFADPEPEWPAAASSGPARSSAP